jgi:hypothetical protein
MPSGVTDWRSWTSQQEIQSNTPFPGQAAITDFELISNLDSYPTYAVTAASGANPSVLTIGAHTIAVGDVVQVSGALGATALNGVWPVTAVDATHITLSTGANGAGYTSGASVQPTGLFTLVDSGNHAVPTYPYTPTGVVQADPFAGWTSQEEFGVSFAITGVTAANPAVITIGAHPLLVGDVVAIAGAGGTSAINGSQTITAIAATTITVAVTGVGYTSGGTVRMTEQRPAVTGVTS